NSTFVTDGGCEGKYKQRQLHGCLARSLRGGGAVEVLRAVFEGGDHSAHRLMEQQLDDALQDPRLEFEIDKEIEPATACHLLEHPVVVEVAERALGIGHIDAARRVERDARGKPLAEH